MNDIKDRMSQAETRSNLLKSDAKHRYAASAVRREQVISTKNLLDFGKNLKNMRYTYEKS